MLFRAALLSKDSFYFYHHNISSFPYLRRMAELNHDFDVPLAELNAIMFDLMTSTDMEKMSSVSIIELSDVTGPKLGLPNGSPQCDTCGSQNTRDCDGHFGVTKLAATVYNPYFIDEVVQFLNLICPGCLNPKENVNMEISERAPVPESCKYCSKDGAKTYPSVTFKTLSSPRVLLSKSTLHRSSSVMERISIVAEALVSIKSNSKGSSEVLPQDYWDFLPSEHQTQPNVSKIILSPYQVFHMLKKIDPVLIEQFISRRELLFLSSLPVTPNRHRVVEMGYGLSDGPRLTFDDRTKAYRRMVDVSKRIDDYRQHPQFSVLASSLVSSRLAECLKSSKARRLISFYDQKLRITDGELLTRSFGSKWLQNSTSGLFSVMFEQYGCRALDLLSSAQEVLCEFLTMRGLSVSLSDLYMLSDHYSRRKLAEGVKLALDEAEEALRIKHILLDPANAPILKCYDNNEKVSCSYSKSNSIQSTQHITRYSIMAFKDVFNNLLKMVQQHVSNDNSMMAMINSGSKGSMLKYAQQTACVGLQLPASKFPFTIPSQLSCVCWNKQKLSDCEIIEGSNENLGGQNLYAVIRSSFIDGLNPLECLLHAISGRANFFSENADVPGTLTRKLMYHLRDLHVAYDGTVRSSYGQQIMQFSYDSASEMYCDRGPVGEFGAPVGSWAACSISEAAYGALEQPVNGLEDSPLMNLQEIFKCHKATNSRDHVGLLFLSKSLKKFRFGLEYASLEVKNHLERVDFCDLVETIMILYDGCEKTRKGSPWTTHFHLSQEMMKKRRLGLRFVVEELTTQLNSLIPSICISKSKCLVGDGCAESPACCVTVVVQAESDSISQLNSLKNREIPIILDTLLKGFLEFKDVEIQCHNDSDLAVKVAMSEHCKTGKFWATLQNACVPIMELIDWERSQSQSIYDIFCSYGIDTAWNYFVQSLRSTTADVGRIIRREHLLIVADSLSVSGQFHGLSSQGLKQQRNRFSVSSPFSEACFSRPAQSFINAAKHSSVDNLCGSLDAIAWGKEPFNGTSGPFEILYSRKSHEPKQKQSIYDFLCNPEVGNSEKDCMDTCKQSTENDSRWRLACKSNDSAIVNGGTISIDQDLLHAKVGIWDNINDMRTCLQNMLREYPLNELVKEPEKSHLMEALKFHPRADQKISFGVREFKIGLNPNHPSTRCFILQRKDGTTEDFSYIKCVLGAANSISPQLRSYLEKKLYHRA
ncbi:hypothetical protein EJB05_16875, partial [Eragrostis curvula]